MSTKWLVFALMLWVVLVFVGVVLETGLAPNVPYGYGQEKTILETLMSLRVFNDVTIAGQTVFWVPNWSWFGAVVSAFTFDFVFFEGTSYGQMMRWIFFAPILAAMTITIGLALVRGVSST